jgi:hypothetical protein
MNNTIKGIIVTIIAISLVCYVGWKYKQHNNQGKELYGYCYSEKHAGIIGSKSICEIYFENEWQQYTYCVPTSYPFRYYLNRYSDAFIIVTCERHTYKLRINGIVHPKIGK